MLLPPLGSQNSARYSQNNDDVCGGVHVCTCVYTRVSMRVETRSQVRVSLSGADNLFSETECLPGVSVS